jgi:hypothetical protein
MCTSSFNWINKVDVEWVAETSEDASEDWRTSTRLSSVTNEESRGDAFLFLPFVGGDLEVAISR